MSFTPESFQKLPNDPILGLNEEFKADKRDCKVNLGVGVYLNAEGVLPVMKAVTLAKAVYAIKGFNHGYGPMSGSKPFYDKIRQVLLGHDLDARTAARWASVQTLSGTGALSLGASLLVEMGYKTIVLPQQTWGNHFAIFSAAGLETQTYPFLDMTTHTVDTEALLACLRKLSPKTVVLLHACCHNPTGADMPIEAKRAILDVCAERQLIPFFDNAYQGLGVGLDEDAQWVREAVERGIPLLVAQSCSKIFGLYGERVGALHVLAEDEHKAVAIHSHLSYHIRTTYSNPPAFGAHLVNIILSDADFTQTWLTELNSMRARIIEQRQRLSTALLQLGLDMRFMAEQQGMFSLTGLTQAQMQWLRRERAVYGVDNSRICFSGINETNYQYVAQAIADAARQQP